MRGRKAKPIKRRIAEGDRSKVGVHKLEEALAREPKPSAGLPPCPHHLTGPARRAWRLWRDELEAMDMDRRPDAVALEGACVNYARSFDADAILRRDGLVVENLQVLSDGRVIVTSRRKHPAFEISARSWKLVLDFCSEFGLTPGARLKFALSNDRSAEDDLANLLNAPRGETDPARVN